MMHGSSRLTLGIRQGVKGKAGGIVKAVVQQLSKPCNRFFVRRLLQDRRTDGEGIQEPSHHMR
jgi:hypothetical protein